LAQVKFLVAQRSASKKEGSLNVSLDDFRLDSAFVSHNLGAIVGEINAAATGSRAGLHNPNVPLSKGSPLSAQPILEVGVLLD
jgi:hypothetical protein